VRSMDVVLPIRDSSNETREARLRVVARPDRQVADLLVRLGLDLSGSEVSAKCKAGFDAKNPSKSGLFLPELTNLWRANCRAGEVRV
jgi:hypothetical protein